MLQQTLILVGAGQDYQTAEERWLFYLTMNPGYLYAVWLTFSTDLNICSSVGLLCVKQYEHLGFGCKFAIFCCFCGCLNSFLLGKICTDLVLEMAANKTRTVDSLCHVLKKTIWPFNSDIGCSLLACGSHTKLLIPAVSNPC